MDRVARLQTLILDLGGEDKVLPIVERMTDHKLTDTIDDQYLELDPDLVEVAMGMTVVFLVQKRGIDPEKVLKFAELMLLSKGIAWEAGLAVLNGEKFRA